MRLPKAGGRTEGPTGPVLSPSPPSPLGLASLPRPERAAARPQPHPAVGEDIRLAPSPLRARGSSPHLTSLARGSGTLGRVPATPARALPVPGPLVLSSLPPTPARTSVASLVLPLRPAGLGDGFALTGILSCRPHCKPQLVFTVQSRLRWHVGQLVVRPISVPGTICCWGAVGPGSVTPWSHPALLWVRD